MSGCMRAVATTERERHARGDSTGSQGNGSSDSGPVECDLWFMPHE
jgi:hypothetical protein